MPPTGALTVAYSRFSLACATTASCCATRASAEWRAPQSPCTCAGTSPPPCTLERPASAGPRPATCGSAPCRWPSGPRRRPRAPSRAAARAAARRPRHGSNCCCDTSSFATSASVAPCPSTPCRAWLPPRAAAPALTRASPAPPRCRATPGPRRPPRSVVRACAGQLAAPRWCSRTRPTARRLRRRAPSARSASPSRAPPASRADRSRRGVALLHLLVVPHGHARAMPPTLRRSARCARRSAHRRWTHGPTDESTRRRHDRDDDEPAGQRSTACRLTWKRAGAAVTESSAMTSFPPEAAEIPSRRRPARAPARPWPRCANTRLRDVVLA